MIDEKKLIDELNEWSNLDKEMNELVLLCIDTFKRMINKQPKVGEWIPLSERLPKQDKLLQDYLVTFEYYRYGEYNRKFKTIGIGTFDNLNREFTFINGQTGWRDLKVFAWMPLPAEPYEVKDND